MIHYKEDYQEYLSHQGSYDYAIIDPPWCYNQPTLKPTKKNQLCFTIWDSNNRLLDLINQLEVDYIFLWVTNPLLFDIFKLIEKQKTFKYKALLTWGKLSKNGDFLYGTGYTFRNCTEHLMCLSRNGTKALRLNIRNIHISKQGKRTAKPHEKEIEIVDILSKRGLKGIYLFSGGPLSFIDTVDIV